LARDESMAIPDGFRVSLTASSTLLHSSQSFFNQQDHFRRRDAYSGLLCGKQLHVGGRWKATKQIEGSTGGQN
jgi:hypothetical protein